MTIRVEPVPIRWDYVDIHAGKLPGVSMMHAMGEFESGNVDAAGEDVCRWEDVSGPPRLYTPAAGGEQVTFVSDNNADNGATTTGVLTLRMYYLDTSYAEQTEDITLNGTTPVNSVATNVVFVNDLHTLTVGSKGVAEGNIAAYKTGDTIGNTLHQMIAMGGNKSLVPHRMVPDGKTLYLMEWHCEEAQNKRSAFRIRSTDMHGVLLPGVFCFKDVAYITGTSSGVMSLHARKVPSRSIVKVTHWDDIAGAEGSCAWWGYLVDD